MEMRSETIEKRESRVNKKDSKKRKGIWVEISFHLQNIANFPYYMH